MLNESFIFLPGVQARTEERLWQHGVRTWEDLCAAPSVPGVSSERLLFWKQRIRQAMTAARTDDGLLALSRLFGTRHNWRLYQYLLDNPRFLDIETSEYRTDVTVVGVSDGEFYTALVKGKNLSVRSLHQALAGASCIITFNGSCFDLPVLARAFPGGVPDTPHIDLRFVCAHAGLAGGLKRIERQLGIRRADALRDVDGADAILLWHQHRLGDETALSQLIDYNAADVLNLAPLADKVIPALWRALRHKEALPFTPHITA
jgi:hypothetical protein